MCILVNGSLDFFKDDNIKYIRQVLVHDNRDFIVAAGFSDKKFKGYKRKIINV